MDSIAELTSLPDSMADLILFVAAFAVPMIGSRSDKIHSPVPK